MIDSKSRLLRRSRVAVLAQFFVLGAATAAWSSRLPAIKAGLGLSDGQLGLALFAVPAGSVLTMVFSGRLADRFGAIPVTRIAGVLVPAALVGVGLARSLPALMVLLAIYGALSGLLDVSMNSCGTQLEAAYQRPILSSLHAGYSIAGLAGAGIGGAFAAAGLGPLPAFATAAVLLAGLALVTGRRICLPAPAPAPAPDQPSAPAQPSAPDPAPGREPVPSPDPDTGGAPVPRPGTEPASGPRAGRGIGAAITIMALVALCGQVGEGSAGDWSAVYLHVNLGAPADEAALALAAFSVTMAAGRVAGDRLARRFGPVTLIRVSGLTAGLGLAAGLVAGGRVAAILGFALLGLGLAGIFPQVVSAAARLAPDRAGRVIATIATVSYSGLLGGPVVIGAVAAGVGLRDALFIPVTLAMVAAALAVVLRPREPARQSAS